MKETNRKRAIRHKWTDEEVEFIINYWQIKTDEWVDLGLPSGTRDEWKGGEE